MGPVLDSCDALILEANHDLDLLNKFSGYPEVYKARIRSPLGHLPNDQTMQFINEHIELENNQWIAPGHLSPRTNSPRRALGSIPRAFPNYDRFSLAPSMAIFVFERNRSGQIRKMIDE